MFCRKKSPNYLVSPILLPIFAEVKLFINQFNNKNDINYEKSNLQFRNTSAVSGFGFM